eukprot:13174863-Ditylum_brightwellii.AAC.1
MELWKSGSSPGMGYRRCSRDKMLCRDSQSMQLSRHFLKAEIDHGNQTVPHFELCLDDVAEHVFPKKDGQSQK